MRLDEGLDILESEKGKKMNKSIAAGGDRTHDLTRFLHWGRVLFHRATTAAYVRFSVPVAFLKVQFFFQRDLFTIFSLPVVENYFNEIGFQFGNQVRKSG